MDNKLKIFQSVLWEYNPKIYEVLNVPAKYEYIVEKLTPFYKNDFIVKFATIFKTICNGTKISYNEIPAIRFHIIQTFFLNSIDQIISILNDDDFYNFVDNNLIPIFSSGYGEYLALNVKDFMKNGLETKVIICSTSDIEIDSFTGYFDSVNQLTTTAIKCYETNIYYTNDQGHLESNFDEGWDLSAKMNPDSYYWNRN